MNKLSQKTFVCVALFCLLGLMTGCSRAIVSTEIKQDGTWTRNIQLHGALPNVLGGASTSLMTLDKTFVLPSGASWKTTRKPEKPQTKENNAAVNPFDSGGEVFTAERTLNVGDSLDHDIALKSSDAKATAPIEVNTVRVKRLSPTRIEYVEVIRWKGKEPPLSNFGGIPITDKKALDALKQLLPANLQTPAQLSKLQVNVAKEVWQLFFGPGDPLLAEMFGLLFMPDIAERKITRRMFDAFDRALEETYEKALSQEQRYSIVRRIASEQFKDFKVSADKQKSNGSSFLNGAGKGDDLTGLTAMTFSVKVPGKVIETNGEYDPVKNEVYWMFYSPAPVAGDLRLYLVCEVPAKK